MTEVARKLDWRIGIQTDGETIGLHNHYDGRRLFIGFPRAENIFIPEDMVLKTLEVVRGIETGNIRPLEFPNQDAAKGWEGNLMFTQTNASGAEVSYLDFGTRLWAKFMGAPEAEGGRVWVDYSNFSSYSYEFPVFRNNGFDRVSYGHEQSWSIFTVETNAFNDFCQDAPTNQRDAVQRYKDRFIDLVVQIAFMFGHISRVNFDFGANQVLEPAKLEEQRYQHIEWLDGKVKQRVRAEKEDRVVILTGRGNEWNTVLSVQTPKPDSYEATIALIAKELSSI